ncbi:uncharacterized protein LOC112171995 isoform X1 [Rosa chinensis]|uniref:uncharacterized protein LOC112171995 isoform X1 n=1 Tax=Rosa chinensis TaxID=74649 RepID=UPI000D08E22D|nr:uncharacterized protein LOC112171995 isoform X1 [Rosa chinensis]XP_040364723.1 uncharacterized protein LOC112171995 isoform X1 [Rosa chinensis]
MRFKKGDKVEVLSQKEVPSGAWQCGVIVSGNGHTYGVRYDWSPNVEGEAIVERVPRKAIRPCPPPVQSADSWGVGDVVEVFDFGFWKMAKVVKVFDENYYLARLLGSSEEFRMHKSRIRVRQLLKDDKWIVIGKVNLRIKLPSRNEYSPSLENSSCQESYIVSSTSLKRACPYTEAYPRKMRAMEKECEHQQVFSRSPSSLLKKVDVVAYPREKLGEKYMHSSFLYPTTRYFEKENRNLNGASSCFERSSEVSGCDSDSCSIESVGSCSVNGNNSSKTSGYDLAGNSEEADTLCSDADSFSSGADLQENVSLPLKHDIAATIHRLELHAYRQTLMVMHASGSLSWEQEDLLTTLRMSLHITNDEHLMEVRNLISAGTKLYVR